MPGTPIQPRGQRWILAGLAVLVVLLSALAPWPHVAGDAGALHDHLDHICLACVAAAHPAVTPEGGTTIEPLRACRLQAPPPAPARASQETCLAYLSRAPPACPGADPT